MTVYVDQLFTAIPRTEQARRYGSRWCHMTADTLEELHQMASRIGMSRSWFQPKSSPHYDLVPSKRALAVSYGAVEIDQWKRAREAAVHTYEALCSIRPA